MVTTAPAARQRPASFTNDEVEVIVARPDVGSEAVSASAQLLTDRERERATRFALEPDRRRFIVVRALLRQLLAARLGVRPEAIELAAGARGKPALAGRFAASDLRFNVSHCQDVAVYAFSSGREVGIDVEAVRELPDADDVAARWFSRQEYATYRALEPGDRALGFFQCWTRKEAFIKALGDGLFHPLDRFDVSLAPGEPARILRVEDVPGDRCRWQLEGFSPVPGFVAAVVAERSIEDDG
jgi:4'-phosphopantetheinyl transferase